MDQTFELDNSLPIGSQLISALRAAIVTGALKPGTRLSEQDTASLYGLSRQPVREAFIRLAAERLVEIRPQRGTFVCRIDLRDVETSRFVREAVEADIVRSAARLANDATKEELKRHIDLQEKSLPQGGKVFMQLDEAFHRLLATAAQCGGAWYHIQPIKMHMDRVRYLTTLEFSLDHLVGQHRMIVDAICAGDEDSAETAIRQHLRNILADLKRIDPQLKKAFFTTSAKEPAIPVNI